MESVEQIDLSKHTIAQLKAILVKLKMRTTGAKGELIARLEQCDVSEVKRVIGTMAPVLNSDLDEQTLGAGVSTATNEGESVERLRADINGLQRNMETLVQQLQTVINSTTLSREAVMRSNTPEGTVALEQSSVHRQPTSELHVQNQRMNTQSPISQIELTTTTTTTASPQNLGLSSSVQNNEPIAIDNRMMPQPRMRDMVEIMPEFDPCVSDITSKQFIDRIEQLKNAYNWSESLVLIAVQNKVKGAAKSWVDAHPVFTSWSQFVSSFLCDFPCVVNAADVHISMMHTRNVRNESLIEYYYKMLALGRRGNVDDQSVIRYVVNGLYDDGLRKSLSAMQFLKCADLLATLNNVVASAKKGTNNTSSSLQPLMTTPTAGKPMISDNTKKSETKNSSAGPICYNCRDRGHIAKNCPQPQRKLRCQKCFSNNHSTDNCSRGGSSSVNAIMKDSSNDQKSDLTKIIDINDVWCKALIDSGSCKSLISSRCAGKCGGKVVPHDEILYGFAGSEYRCREAMVATITIDGVKRVCQLLIVDSDKMAFDAIVGTNVLSKFGRIIIEDGTCRVDGNNIQTGEDLTAVEESQLTNLINNYAECFGEKLCELGKCSTMNMTITLMSTKPIVRKPYPIPIPKQKSVEKIVAELLSLEVIRPSVSRYASPVVLVRKQNGEDRLCVDYRELNAITEKEPWPMPTVDGVLSTLAGKKYFTTLDLMSGYYQIEVAEKSRQYTAFMTHNGHFEFNRMPFGLRNAPCSFQRMMLQLIEPIRDKVVSYVDEVIVASKTVEEGLTNFEDFLRLVKEAGLTLRLSKCVFMRKTVTFLGHEIDEYGIRPGLVKTIAIQKFPRPQNATEVRRFLGLTGFFRKFVPNYALIAYPLTQLTKKEVIFKWSDGCEKSFNKLIELLSNEPILTVYDVNKEHQVHTDASSVGLAGILLQQEGQEVLKPIIFFSRACNEAERSYHGYELEVLAVVESCERFRMYLLGHQFTVVTDCTAVSTCKLSKPMLPRISRWFLKLLEFDFIIIHRSGSAMRHVDAMSRAAVEPPTEAVDVSSSVMYVQVPVDDWLVTMQKQDSKINDIIETMTGKKDSCMRKSYVTDYILKKNRLFRKATGDKLLLVVPRGMRWRIVKLCHDDAGHPGVQGTLSRINGHFWFPRARNFVKGYLKSCPDCCYSREPAQKECQLYGMEIPSVPFEVLHIDHLGPFVKSRRGYEHILVVVDALTRYTIIFAVRTTKTKPVVDALNQLTLYFGMPKTVVTDRGTSFTSAMFETFCHTNSVQHIKVAVRTPRANGLAERVNQSILAFLKASTTPAKDWDLELRTLQWTINTRVSATTRYAPIDLIFDFPLRDISGNKVIAALHDDDCDLPNLTISEKRSAAIENIESARQVWKARFDAKHKKPHEYKVGDLVLIHSAIPSTGESRKLEVKYRGPYTISKVLRFDRYVVEDIDGLQLKSKRFSTIASSDKLKPWCELYPQVDDDYDDADNHDSEYEENNQQ